MEYKKFTIIASQEISEILLAYLEDLPFDMFEETTTGMDAFIPAMHYTDAVIEDVKALQHQFDFEFEMEHVPDQNWNIKWESNFEPVLIDD